VDAKRTPSGIFARQDGRAIRNRASEFESCAGTESALADSGLAHDDDLWAAVADPTRRRLLDLLLARGGATATALAEELPVSRQAVAKHLAVLDRNGLVDARREGREVRYTVRPERLEEARKRMADIAAEWEDRLAAIKRIAEADTS
jgi:DNA-binding transcriptional ArsR family regulator